MDLLSSGRGAPPFFVGEEEDDGDEYDLEDDELEHFHRHGPGCSHHHHDEADDAESLLEVLPRFMRKGQPEPQTEGGGNDDENQDDEEEGEIMSADEACIFNAEQ